MENYYKALDISKPILNPKGAGKSYSPSNPDQTEHVMKDVLFYATILIVQVLEFLQKNTKKINIFGVYIKKI